MTLIQIKQKISFKTMFRYENILNKQISKIVTGSPLSTAVAIVKKNSSTKFYKRYVDISVCYYYYCYCINFVEF